MTLPSWPSICIKCVIWQLFKELLKENVLSSSSLMKQRLSKLFISTLDIWYYYRAPEFPAQRPVAWSFDVFFDQRLKKRLSKQSCGWWDVTPWRSLWRHCNGMCLRERHYISSDPFRMSYLYYCGLSDTTDLNISCIMYLDYFHCKVSCVNIDNDSIIIRFLHGIIAIFLKRYFWHLLSCDHEDSTCRHMITFAYLSLSF